MTTQQEQAVEDFLGEEVPAPVGEFAIQPGQKLASSVGGQPIGAKVTEVDRGRWMRIYNTRTGVSSKTNVVHRPFLDPTNSRAWRWSDGTMMCSLTPPIGITPVRGEFKCHLHPDHPNRARYDEIGLQGKTCFEDGGGKDGIPSEYDVTRHMRRHKDEWALIQADDAKRERMEEREWQRSLLLMARGEISAESAVKTAPGDLTANSTKPQPKQSVTKHSVPCLQCETLHNARSLSAAKSKLRAHMKIAHPEAA